MNAAIVFVELLYHTFGVDVHSRHSLQYWFLVRQILVIETHNSHVGQGIINAHLPLS